MLGAAGEAARIYLVAGLWSLWFVNRREGFVMGICFSGFAAIFFIARVLAILIKPFLIPITVLVILYFLAKRLVKLVAKLF